MKGSAGALAVVHARLVDDDQGIAATLAQLEDADGEIDGVPLVDTDPPTAGFALLPGLIADYPRARLELDEYPAVLLVPQDSPRRRLTSIVDGCPIYTITHRIRIFSIVRGPDHVTVGRARDRLDVAIDEALHRNPQLADNAVLIPEATVGSKSDVDVDDTDQRSVAGAYLEVTVEYDDRVEIPPFGTADTIDLTVDPPHPGLD